MLSLRGLTIITSVSQGIKVDLDFGSSRWSIQKALSMFDWSPADVEK